MKHFEFGKNWDNYSQVITEIRVKTAEQSLVELVGIETIQGRKVLDIGSGSGIHSLSFLRAGAAHVDMFDYDLDSVNTSKKLIRDNWTKSNWGCFQGDILNCSNINSGYDIVYSWGVLHHTGNLRKALINASQKVTDEGLLVIALYKKTPMCFLWKIEKYIYTHSGNDTRALLLQLYRLLFKVSLFLKRKNFRTYEENYYMNRGMDLTIDMIDWLGGYPYESISAKNTEKVLNGMDFQLVKSKISGARFGFLGTGCSEFVFKKKPLK